MRRGVPVVLAVVVAALLVWYVVYTQRVVRQLKVEASRIGQVYARVYRALGDTSEAAGTAALLDISEHIRESGVPVIVTDSKGTPTAAANLPFKAGITDPRVRHYVSELDALNPPVVEPGVGMVHFGHTPLVRGLRVVPAVQATMLALVLIAALMVIWTRGRADRERVWAGMARESAHQLGTPLTSLSGWVELLAEQDSDALISAASTHMRADLERLERVAHRFERIGRQPKREPIDVGELVERVAGYFRARVPTLAHSVVIASSCEGGPLRTQGDPVLLEWAVESIVKNAIDALAGRGGRVDVSAAALPEGRVRVRVADDGPGVPREIRRRIFEPGFSTKSAGWGIGLALAKRIVEENHGGHLALVPSNRGAIFDVILEA